MSKRALSNRAIGNNALWLKDYLELYRQAIFDDNGLFESLIQVREMWEEVRTNRKKVIFVGNGGSAAIASHCAVDLTKNTGIRGVDFNEASLITCFSNDYGYANWVAEAIRCYADDGDVAVLISSSGRSPNILSAAAQTNRSGLSVVTFSGFDSDNPLRECGSVNLWVRSHVYNVVEMTHHIWLVAVIDMIAEKYSPKCKPGGFK